MKNFFKTRGILGKDWVRSNNTWISMFSIKNYVRDQIDVIDDGEEKEWMESICDRR